MPMRALLPAATLAALLAAPALAADGVEKPERECIYARNINGWNFISPDTVRITVGVNDKYDLKLFSRQTELRFRNDIGIRTRGSNWICSPLDVEVVGGEFTGRVPVVSITKVEETTAAAKPAG